MKNTTLNQIRPAARRAVWSARIAVAAILAISSGNALAGAFTQGNIVVERVGDGTQTLASTGNTIFFDEITTGGTPVQSIQIPDSGGTALIDSGTATSDGAMTLSADGKSLVFPGYNTARPYGSSVTGAASTAVPRGIGKLDVNGNYTLPVTSTSAFSANNIRGAVTDGNNNFWGSGTASAAPYGVVYFGTASAASAVYNANIRCVGIFNGNLWYSTASSTGIGYGIAEFSGLPTTAATPTKVLALASTDGTYNFSMNPAGNVIYYADDGDESATRAGIHKWTLSGATWSQAYVCYSNAVFGLVVDWTTIPATIYATTAPSADNANALIMLQDTGTTTATATTLATAAAKQWYRGVAFAPNNGVPAAAPTITSITPASVTTNAGSTVAFVLTGTTGTPMASNLWYKVVGSTTNLISGATGTTLTLNNVSSSDAASYFAVLTNASGNATSAVVSLIVSAGPSISGISPTSVTTNAGSTVTFTLTASSGVPAASNLWYKVVGSTTNWISSATGTTLTLNNVGGGDTANYFAILTNVAGSATSAVVSLTVNGDPSITIQPASAYGLLDGTVQFAVTAVGTSPTYQWFFSDPSGNPTAPVSNGTQGSGSMISGATSSMLTINNAQFIDPTNWFVVVSNAYGMATSSVASLLSVSTNAILAFWDFNGPEFTNYVVNPNCVNNPVPYLGVGSAQAVGSTYNPGPYPFTSTSFSPFSGSVDPNDGMGFTSHLPPFSWGTDHYPASGGNKQNGVQFNVSTVGAKNIKVSYESRVSATASDYERLQYTTNGTTWIDYPASSTFNNVGTTYEPFSYDLSGFPGVANNPDFGFRVVTEFQSTATYGISANAGYLGTANTYGTAGTVTYDLVTVSGDAITNNNAPPTISSFSDTNTPDYIPLTLNFTVSDDTTPPDQLTYSAESFNWPTVSPSFTFGGSGANRTLTITPNTIPDQIDAAPILVTVTDTNGDSTVTWFLLTLTSVNLAPTNSLTSLKETNTLANTALTIPFAVGDDRTPVSGLTYSVASGNTTLVPTGNIVINGAGTANPSVTITPAANQLGVGVISVSVNDNDLQEQRTNTATIAFMVRPNTNIVAIDYFDYDASGALDSVSGGFWQHLTGVYGQVKVGSGVVTVDTLNNTENLQTPLLNGPYQANSGAVLYASYMVNIMDSSKLPNNNGSYFTTFNDGSGVTGFYECLVVAATNGAAPGNYRLGIVNSTNDGPAAITATSAQMFPQDLIPGNTYIVVTSLVLSNGFSTLWINPNCPSSPSVTDTIPALPLDNIADFELRESGANAGIVSVSYLKVGTTFDSVLPSLHIQTAPPNVIVNWSDPTLGIQSATNVTGPYTDVSPATPPYTTNATMNNALFFRFSR